MTITLAFGSGNGYFLSHRGNRIYHFMGSHSLVVYHGTLDFDWLLSNVTLVVTIAKLPMMQLGPGMCLS